MLVLMTSFTPLVANSDWQWLQPRLLSEAKLALKKHYIFPKLL